MRGNIIHYNPNEAKGLVSANGMQYAFTITEWKCDTAPAVNTAVDFELKEDTISDIRKVTDDVLIKEKASELASKLGSFSGKALDDVKTAASSMNGNISGNIQSFYGKPLLIAHSVFAFSAIFLPFIKIMPDSPMGKSFSLSGLSDINGMMGISLGGGALVWLAIIAIIVPYFWRNKFSWLLLLLPLIASLRPVWEVMQAISKAEKQMGGLMGSEFSAQMAKQMSSMVDLGFGAILCFISAATLAIFGLKRFLINR